MDANGRPNFEEILEGLKALQQELNKREEAAQAELDAVRAERRSIDQMISAAERTGRYGSKNTKPPKQSRTRTETVERVYTALREATIEGVSDDLPGTFTNTDAAAISGVHGTTTRQVLRQLREDGRIRLVGERVLGAHGGRSSIIYALAD